MSIHNLPRPKTLLLALATSAALLALALMPTLSAAQELSDIQSNGNLHLRGYGNGFIEGNTHSINADTARGGVSPELSPVACR